MSMIETLTKEQEEQLEVYKNKWIEIGLQTTPCDRAKCEKLIKEIYKEGKLDPPIDFLWFDSPLAAQQYATLNISKDIGINDFCYGNHDAAWLSFYDYFLHEVKIKDCNPLIPTIEFAKIGHWFFPLKDQVLFVERPTQIHLNEKKQLHCETGPAISYKDGFAVYALNGIRVAANIVNTPANELDPKLILTTKNAEIRREIVRKIGLNRMAEKLETKIIDEKEGYQLLSINIGDDRYRPYLKMINPSINTDHIEGVHPDCKTVDAALAWRNQIDIFWSPENLT